MNPVMVIGLGGTGKEVLMLLRKKVVQRFGTLGRFPILGSLHIDSDRSSESQAMPSTLYLGEDISLSESERVGLPVAGGNNWKANDAIRDWFPPDLPIPENFSTGCQAQRNYGRLAFSANFDEIKGRVVKLAAQITNPGLIQTFAANHGQIVTPNIDVFVVCSLLGGTGSGMFIDLCYATRHWLSGYTTLYYGYLVTGGPTATEDQKANCYAALMELDHYNARGFTARYPGAQVANVEGHEGPVDWMYLANGINSEGVHVPPQVVWECVADNILAEITPGIKDRRKGIRDNMSNAGYREPDRVSKPQCYLSFGMASIEFPALNLQDALSYRLGSEALSRWKFEQTPQEDHIKLADRDLDAWRLKPDITEEDLLKDDAGISHLKRIAAKVVEQKTECLSPRLLEKQNRAELRTKLETFRRNNDSDVERLATLDQSGALIKQLDHRRQALLEDLAQKRLLPRAIEMCTDGNAGGIRNTRGYLEALEARLRNAARDHENRGDHYRRESDQAYDEQGKLHQVFLEDLDEGRFVVKRHVEDLLDVSAHYQSSRLRSTANEMARQLLEGILAEIAGTKRKLDLYGSALDRYAAEMRAQHERRYASIFMAGGLSDVMLTRQEGEDIYRQCVPDELLTAIKLKTQVETGLSQALDLFTVILKSPGQVVDLLIDGAKDVFSEVRNTSIATRLAGLTQDLRDNKISTANRHAHALLQVDSERRRRYGNIAAPQNTEIVLIATPDPAAEPSLARNGDLRRAIEAQIPILEQNLVQTLPDCSRLVWSYELGVFSLHCVKDFADYREIYRGAQARPRHTHRGIEFADLFPGDEAEIRARSKRAAVLGQALGVLVWEEDPVIRDLAVYFYYGDRHGRHSVRVGDGLDDVAVTLAESQRRKDVMAITQETTALERLEAAIKQIGVAARARPEKEQIWTSLQAYLDRRSAEIPGGLRSAEYQTEERIVNDLRDMFDFNPPANWDFGTSDSLPISTPAQALETPLDAEAGFRLRVAELRGTGTLTSAHEVQLLEEAYAKFGLSFADTQRIIDDVRREVKDDGSWSAGMREFERVLRELSRDGGESLDEGKRTYLAGVARVRGLSEAEQHEVMDAVMGRKNA